MPGSTAEADRALYARTHPTWYGQRFYGPPAPEEFALRTRRWTAMALAETREEFYERLGHAPRPLKAKRGPSKRVLWLEARVAELEALLTARGEVAA